MPFFTSHNSLQSLLLRRKPPRTRVSGSYGIAAGFYPAALPLYRDVAAVGAASSR
jgi:hypothetical protein